MLLYKTCLLRTAIITVLLFSLNQVFGVPPYRVVELSTLGGSSSYAYGINSQGHVVGKAKDTNDNTRAVLWQNGQTEDLGCLPGGEQAVARAINDSGTVAGYSFVNTTNYHAFRYEDGTMYDLHTCSGPISRGLDINNAGDISGDVTELPGNPWATSAKACIFDTSGVISNVGLYNTSYQNREGWGINNHTQVVGITFTYVTAGRWRGFVWQDMNGNRTNDTGDTQMVGTFGGDWVSQLYDINDNRVTVGSAHDVNNIHWACLIEPTTGGVYKLPPTELVITNALLQNLGALGGTGSVAYAINNKGRIVGTAKTTNGTSHAFSWENGVMTDLNDLIASNSGWVLTHAWDINEANEICGYGTYEGQTRAFLLTFPRAFLTMAPHKAFVGTTIWTNLESEVFTTDVYKTQGFEVRWAESWISGETNYKYTVEYLDLTETNVWQIYKPTNDWPVTENRWTNFFVPAHTHRWFRVRAETY